MIANRYNDNCVEYTQKGTRCLRKVPLALGIEGECWQHRQQPAEVQCSAHTGLHGNGRRCSRRGRHSLDENAVELYCTQHVNKLHRENGRAEVVSANRQQQDEQRRRAEEREQLHPRRRSPRLVEREIAAAAAVQLAAAREQRRAANRANQNLRRSARIAARRGNV
ncbi:uncharacterized protein LOC115926610 [Strongylocentrotus purpuratus]|uniref:Uncharacterized protein n=1 Tax=Strongylocentrotus purpuratus TaxID=7668 RepID=A0A7M7P749_STRPU|nr:uncharacterized protein LOC115926604 [Strongylocentrotus purpuratus]XP_030847334.1 uncharacterized protein LOC115926610 [Strongylocentrotus purpuratus]